MGNFAKYLSTASATGLSQTAPVQDAVVDATPPVIDGAPAADPLDGVDATEAFEQERQENQARQGEGEGDGEGTGVTDGSGNEDGENDDLDDLDMFVSESAGIDMLGLEMEQLAGAALAIENFGINPSSLGVLQATGLLSGTSLDALALESMSGAAEAETDLALEALGEKIKEKAGAWSAKILNFTKNVGSKTLAVITGLWNTVSNTAKSLTASAWDKTKAAGAVIKAHPYKTLAAVAASIAVVASILVLVTGGAPAVGAKVDVIKSFLMKIVDNIKKINFPGAKITAKLNAAGDRIVIETIKAGLVVEQAAVSALGWTETAVKAIGSQLGRAVTHVKDGWGALGTKATKLGGTVVDVAKTTGKAVNAGARGAGFGAQAATGSALKSAGASANLVKDASTAAGIMGAAGYYAYLIGVLTSCYQLTKFVVIGGLRMVSSTFSALKPHTASAA
jgi:hypothetical protein